MRPGARMPDVRLLIMPVRGENFVHVLFNLRLSIKNSYFDENKGKMISGDRPKKHSLATKLLRFNNIGFLSTDGFGRKSDFGCKRMSCKSVGRMPPEGLYKNGTSIAIGKAEESSKPSSIAKKSRRSSSSLVRLILSSNVTFSSYPSISSSQLYLIFPHQKGPDAFIFFNVLYDFCDL